MPAYTPETISTGAIAWFQDGGDDTYLKGVVLAVNLSKQYALVDGDRPSGCPWGVHSVADLYSSDPSPLTVGTRVRDTTGQSGVVIAVEAGRIWVRWLSTEGDTDMIMARSDVERV